MTPSGESIWIGARVRYRDAQPPVCGTVTAVDPDGTVWVRWDTGLLGHVLRPKYLEVV